MSESQPRILMTGGDGRLGTELRQILPGILAPDEEQMDITRPDDIARWLDEQCPDVLLHAAAYTDVAGAEQNRRRCWCVNVVGTRNVVRAAGRRGVFLIHISTDYVFEGTRGGYKEDDPPGPAMNYYALTKLVAEELARIHPAHLILRTSFRPREWPYPKAFTDVYTSQDYVDIIAPELALAIRHFRELRNQTLHVVTERKSVYELAKRRKSDVQGGSKSEVSVRLPDDISLDTTRWQELKKQWSKT